MGLETGTYIADLVATNPIFNDAESQGDDHLRLIKSVLQATFPGANRPFPIPTTLGKSADYTVLSTDQNKFILVTTTGGAVVLTLPSLTAADAGWRVYVSKVSNDTNPIIIAPPSGTLFSGQLSLTRTRRCISFAVFKCMWIGGSWFVERCIGAPVGSVLPFFGATLPVGYEWPNGQTLASASTLYPDYNSVRGSGTTPDLRQRSLAGSSLAGADPSRITTAGSGIDGTTLESAGGAQKVTLAQANLPNVTLGAGTLGTSAESGHTHSAGSYSADSGGSHTHTLNNATNIVNNSAGGLTVSSGNPYGIVDLSAQIASGGAHTHTISGTSGASSGHTHSVTGATASINGGVAQTDVIVMPPTIICNYILVVE